MKKENFANKAINDEQLENVAGGTYFESASDAGRFEEIGIKVSSGNVLGVNILMGEDFTKLRNAFKQFGVTIKDNGGLINANHYFIGDKEVSREDAWKHIKSQVK